MSASVLHMSMSLDGFIAGRTRRRSTGSATAGTGCTEWSSARASQPRERSGFRRVPLHRGDRRRSRDLRARGRLGRRPPRRLPSGSTAATTRVSTSAAGRWSPTWMMCEPRSRPRRTRPGEKNVLVHGATVRASSRSPRASSTSSSSTSSRCSSARAGGCSTTWPPSNRAERIGVLEATASPTCATASGAERRPRRRELGDSGQPRPPGRGPPDGAGRGSATRRALRLTPPSPSGSPIADRDGGRHTIWPPCAAKQMRAAAWTEMPTYRVSVSAGRPRCRPIRQAHVLVIGPSPADIARWIAQRGLERRRGLLEHREEIVPASVHFPTAADRTAARTRRRMSARRDAYRSPRRRAARWSLRDRSAGR